jgi:hypothetical protein
MYAKQKMAEAPALMMVDVVHHIYSRIEFYVLFFLLSCT